MTNHPTHPDDLVERVARAMKDAVRRKGIMPRYIDYAECALSVLRDEARDHAAALRLIAGCIDDPDGLALAAAAFLEQIGANND